MSQLRLNGTFISHGLISTLKCSYSFLMACDGSGWWWLMMVWWLAGYES
jgi:hypothetical protein